MSAKSRNWEAKALRNLFHLKKSLERDLNNPIIIYDNGPGVHYSSLNTIVSSDNVVFVSTSDSLDLQGLANLFKEYEDLFEDKTKIVLNKVFPNREQWSEHTKDRFMNKLPEILRKLVIAIIPCYCDFLDPEKQIIVPSEHPLNAELAKITRQLGLANTRLD
jgi:MinD-like ATPase involved in chromosome partitioning or flagellar assembly